MNTRRSKRSTKHRKCPTLAPLDESARQIQRVLDLIKPDLGPDYEAETGKYEGYCGAAAEAYLHLAGGRDSGLRVMRRRNRDGSSHWWLEGPLGVVDLTLSHSDRQALKRGEIDQYPYEDGQGAMFRSGYSKMSKRAETIVHLMKRQHQSEAT